MKKVISIFILISLVFSFTSCQAKPVSELDAVQKNLSNMKSYQADGILTRTSNKGSTTYETKQYAKSSGEYRLELTAPENVKGNYTIFDGAKICQYNPKLDVQLVKNVAPNQPRNELFLFQFIKNYLNSEGVGVTTASIDEAKCVVLEAIIPGSDSAIDSEKLWVDRSSLLPVRLALYDTNGNERYRIDYSNFTFNPTLDENLFIIKGE